MDKDKDQLYEKIKDLKTKAWFDKEINLIQKENDYLFDEEIAALLIVDELGRNKENICKIAALEHGMECTVFGKISYIDKLRKFNRKNGTQGRVINLELSDETGSCRLALWDKDVDLVEKRIIKKGTNVKIINGYVKEGFSGLEINVGRWGLIDINPENIPEKVEEYIPPLDEIIGKIIKKEPTKAFFKDDGEFGFVTRVKIDTKDGVKQIILWDKKVKEIQNFKQGDQIKIRNINIKEINGKKEIHSKSKTTIKRV